MCAPWPSFSLVWLRSFGLGVSHQLPSFILVYNVVYSWFPLSGVTSTFMCYVCLPPALCYPCFGRELKTVILNSPTSPCSLPPHSRIADRTPDRQQKKCLVACFPFVLFPHFVQCFVFCFFFPKDPHAALFTSLARKDLPLLEYVVEFSQLAVLTAFDDAALNSLFWIGANYHCPVDLPDTTGDRGKLSSGVWRASISDLEHTQRGLLFPCLVQAGPHIPSLDQRGLLFPSLAQRGLMFLN